MRQPKWLESLRADVRTVAYFLGQCHRLSRTYLPLLCANALVGVMIPLVNVVMPKYVIDELTGAQRPRVFVALVLVILLLNGGLALLNTWFNHRRGLANFRIKDGFDLMVGRKIMGMDYEKVEDPDMLSRRERAIWVFENHGGIAWFVEALITGIAKLITAATLIALIGAFSPLLLVIILALLAVNVFLQARIQANNLRMWEQIVEGNRYFIYYLNLTGDFSYAKDVRIYGAGPLIAGKFNRFYGDMSRAAQEQARFESKYIARQRVNLQLQMALGYAFLIAKVLSGGIGIGTFTMLASAIVTFTQSVTDGLNSLVNLVRQCKQLGEYVSFMQALPEARTGGEPLPQGPYRIEFRHVSFRYPRSEAYALRDASLTIEPGERLSVVGLNGAGKTTFIKLLCGLYQPESGEILLDGVPITRYDLRERYRLFSVVFQDFKLLAFTARDNIALAGAGAAQDGEVLRAADLAGVGERIRSLPKGLDTNIYKVFDPEGVELSGGEGQKLAIARAIYKDAPIVVLDEPTAALDPLAEYEIYRFFRDLIGDKTTIYISHRMSSCRFCDRIAVFENGSIVQQGTHDQLRVQPGLYAKLWESQAQWYTTTA